MPSPRELAANALRAGKQSLPALGIAGGIALVVGGAYFGFQWITHSPRFAITEFEVAGTRTLGKDDIARLLNLPDNANIFRTDMGALEAKLEASPWIVSAEVSRDLPTSLEIEIREQAPVAVVELEGLYLVNEDGELFKRASLAHGEVDRLAIITGIRRELHVADPEASQRSIELALDALHQFQSNEERPRIGEVHIDDRHGLTLITFEDAIAIHVGTPEAEELSERFRAFDSAWQALDAEEHAAARSFRIADRTPSDRVTVAFAGN